MTSISATERTKLWNQFNTNVDHETVKTDFIRRVHRKNPPFRFKVKPKPRHCAEIPPMVEFHYKNPPPLLPSLRDVLRCERVYREYGLPSIETTQNGYAEIDNELIDLQSANEIVRKLGEEIITENPNEMNSDVVIDKPIDESIDEPIDGMIDGPIDEPINEVVVDEEMQLMVVNGKPEKEMSEVEIIEDLMENIPLERDEKLIEKIANSSTIVVDPALTLLASTTVELEPVTVHSVPITIETEPINSVEVAAISTESIPENGLNEDQLAAEEIESNHSNRLEDLEDTSKLKANRKRKRNTSTKCFTDDEDLLQLSEDVFKSKMSNGTNGTLSADVIDSQLRALDVDVIKRLAFAQLQHILKENPELVSKYQNESVNKAIADALKVKPVKITLPSQMLSQIDIAKIAEQFTNSPSSDDETNERIPAYAGVRHPIAPIPQVDDVSVYYANGFEDIENDHERALAIAKRLEAPMRESKVKARAVLTPVGDILAGKQWYTNSHTDGNIFMRYRNLVIGTGPNCDVQMKNVKRCSRLSAHHATIFYDEVNNDLFVTYSFLLFTSINNAISLKCCFVHAFLTTISFFY